MRWPSRFQLAMRSQRCAKRCFSYSQPLRHTNTSARIGSQDTGHGAGQRTRREAPRKAADRQSRHQSGSIPHPCSPRRRPMGTSKRRKQPRRRTMDALANHSSAARLPPKPLVSRRPRNFGEWVSFFLRGEVGRLALKRKKKMVFFTVAEEWCECARGVGWLGHSTGMKNKIFFTQGHK